MLSELALNIFKFAKEIFMSRIPNVRVIFK